MGFILTLVASAIPLSAGHLAEFEGFADRHGIGFNGKPRWLTPHKAADIPLANNITMEQMVHLRALFQSDKIDVFCTSFNRDRPKRLFLADMDSTIVTSETLDELAAEAGLKDKISAITAKAMRGELDFEGALRERVGLLKGLPVEALHRTLNSTAHSPGAHDLVHHLKDKGVHCVLVSGGFTFFTGAVAAKLGFDTHHGNELEIKDGKLTGTVKNPILDKQAKLNFLNLYAEERDIDMADTIAIGDGANDLPMLQAAGLGIGYHPKPLVEQSILNCILHGDLTAVLYMLGYGDSACKI